MRAALPADLARLPGLWQGRRHHEQPALPTGNPRLDRFLPDGGWPLGALTEWLTDRPGLGEFRLLVPALAELTAGGRWAILIDPPWTPYPPALRGQGLDLRHLLLVRTATPAESLWACEQALRGLAGGAVLAWPRGPADGRIGFTPLRRLQLAARAGRKPAFLFRPATVAGNASPATLRLHLQARDQDLQLRILKCRGARAGASLRLRPSHPPPAPMIPGGDAAAPRDRILFPATPSERAVDALH